jgi:hypothetical protein
MDTSPKFPFHVSLLSNNVEFQTRFNRQGWGGKHARVGVAK